MKLYAFFVKKGQGGLEDDIIDWAISETTKSDYVHCGLIFEGSESSFMFHITRKGVKFHRTEDYEYEFKKVKFKGDPEKHLTEIQEMVAYKLLSGNEYDYLQILKIFLKSMAKFCVPSFISIKDAYICTSPLINVIEIMGGKVECDRELVSPGDLEKSEEFFWR